MTHTHSLPREQKRYKPEEIVAKLRQVDVLISYGFDLMGLFYDIASYVQRLAAGAKPSDMPIEQSPRFYMAVNLKTAALLGVSLSDVFIARANEVRE